MKYAYVEITEFCNLNCPFCPSPGLNSRRIMPAEMFEAVLQKLSGNVQEIFLHVLGEPLSHPEFEKILGLAERYRFPVNLTTNGTLAKKFEETLLLSQAIRQINFSTHAYAYLSPETAQKILDETLSLSDRFLSERPEIYLNFRLWNEDSDETSRRWNATALQILSEHFRTHLEPAPFSVRHKSFPLCGRAYLHRDSRFAWPDGSGESFDRGTCHGVIDQCAVLADGTVVPCCLDFLGRIPLGKISENSFEEIFTSGRARQMAEGFRSRRLVEPFCKRCTFARRFK